MTTTKDAKDTKRRSAGGTGESRGRRERGLCFLSWLLFIPTEKRFSCISCLPWLFIYIQQAGSLFHHIPFVVVFSVEERLAPIA